MIEMRAFMFGVIFAAILTAYAASDWLCRVPPAHFVHDLEQSK